jgi:hypothetical protein
MQAVPCTLTAAGQCSNGTRSATAVTAGTTATAACGTTRETCRGAQQLLDAVVNELRFARFHQGFAH